MSRYLALGLYAEGPSDQTFLRRLLYRFTLEATALLPGPISEVSETWISGCVTKSNRREDRICEAFKRPIDEGALQLLFVHADGGATVDAVRNNNILPGLQQLEFQAANSKFGSVPVIPIRETEAWALADVAALKSVLGTKKTLVELQLDNRLSKNPSVAEAIFEPKKALIAAQRLADPNRRMRGEPAIPVELADMIKLDTLRKLQSVQNLERDIVIGIKRAWNLR